MTKMEMRHVNLIYNSTTISNRFIWCKVRTVCDPNYLCLLTLHTWVPVHRYIILAELNYGRPVRITRCVLQHTVLKIEQQKTNNSIKIFRSFSKGIRSDFFSVT